MTETALQVGEKDPIVPDIGFAVYMLDEGARFKGSRGVLSAQDGVLSFHKEGNEVVSIATKRIQQIIISGAILTVISDSRKYRFSHRESLGSMLWMLLPRRQAVPEVAYQTTYVAEEQVEAWQSYFTKAGVPVEGSYLTSELSVAAFLPGILCIFLGGMTSPGAWSTAMDSSLSFSHSFEKMFSTIWLIGSLSAVLVGFYVTLRNKPLGVPNAISKIRAPGVELINLLLLVCGVLYCVMGIYVMQNPELMPKNPVGGQMILFFGVLHFMAAGLFFRFAHHTGIDTLHYNPSQPFRS